ncbi:DNA polymerase III subunit alpha [Fructobacillus americanaquae]|uniref:DNA polymerase III subunit alpha n=1 Tax=Fructobacillus americanaquae TaxID=2940302 RepID=A0ABY5C058_9LACO|nr:DNA polymerase III subunit alpha [Fructobacillus americanaquae]USS92120.1 DNA polymerase III subunit alpha [Fructobacillus americanaquae]
MYAPLQQKSAYSLLQSPNSVEQIIQVAKDRGYQAVSLAEENVLYSVVAFYKAARKAGIKPVFSLVLQVNGLVNVATAFPVLLTAKNQVGYQNLVYLSSKKMANPDQALQLTDLTGHLDGLSLTLSPKSELGQLIVVEDSAVKNYLDQLTDKVGGADFYLGINPLMSVHHQDLLVAYAMAHQVRLIAWDQVDYLNEEDVFFAQVLRAINQGTQLEDLDLLAREKGAYYLRSQAEIAELYQKNAALRGAYQNNEALIGEANVDLAFKSPALPVFQQDSGLDSKTYLTQLANAGLKRRLTGHEESFQDYQDRLNHELTVIVGLGFADYFLIVWDIVKYARDHHVQTGSGRGSAAGSLVAYTLGITNVDPLDEGLLFERFLNPDRASMPDIDIDWPDDRRDEILAYLHDKYGQESFAQIITFGTLAAKQALRDTARVFGLDAKAQKRLSEGVPAGKNGRKVPLKEAWTAPDQKLKQAIYDLDFGQLLLKTALAIENLPRNYSTHAAGVVLSDQPLVATLPVQVGNDGYLLTQVEKGPVEELGLLKIDILGLTNLKILAQTIALAQDDLPADFDIKKIDFQDKETLQLFANGNTTGIFQFESAGMKNVLKRLEVDDFHLIVAATALYRPGPSQHIDPFIKRRLKQEPVPTIDPVVDQILAPTYGILVYQEQVMQVAAAYAGFSLAQADFLRSAMSKKKLEQMAAVKTAFITGAQQKGHRLDEAEKLFAYIDQFANYGFNKSHAVAYSQLSFQLAYMKAHYPLAFYTAILNAHQGGAEKAQAYLAEVKQLGLKVLPPDVNTSTRDWSIQAGALVMGLGNINGLQTAFVTTLLDSRSQIGRFASLQDLIKALPEKFRDEKFLNQLAYAGALDHFGYNRAELLANLPDLINAASFGDLVLSETKIKKLADLPLVERLQTEKEALGFNLSGHPTEAFQADYDRGTVTAMVNLVAGQRVKVLGLVKNVKIIQTKRGDDMAFVNLTDMTGSVDVTIFPKIYDKVKAVLKVGRLVQVGGNTEVRQGISVIGNFVDAVDASQSQNFQADLDKKHPVHQQTAPTRKTAQSGTWFLRLDEDHDQEPIKNQLWQVMQQNPGDYPVILYWPKTKIRRMLPQSYNLAGSDQLKQALEQVLSSKNVVFRQKD